MKAFLLIPLVLVTFAFQAGLSAEPSLGWPSWLKVGRILLLPQANSFNPVTTNAILIQNFNPWGVDGRAVVGHLQNDGVFTPFEQEVDLRRVELGSLAAIQLQVSGISVSIAENLETLFTNPRDPRSTEARGPVSIKSSRPAFQLAAPSDLSLPLARVDAGPIGQVPVAGRFFKLASPILLGDQATDVLHFGDYVTWDRGRVKFGKLGPNGLFLPGLVRDEPWIRRGTTTYIGGVSTPLFLIFDRNTRQGNSTDVQVEIFEQPQSWRIQKTELQRSQLSVLDIKRRIELYTVDVTPKQRPEKNLSAQSTRPTDSELTTSLRQPVRQPPHFRTAEINGGVMMCEHLFATM